VCNLLNQTVGMVSASTALKLSRSRTLEVAIFMRAAAIQTIAIRSIGNMKLPHNKKTIRARSVLAGQGLGYIQTVNKSKTQTMAPHCNLLFCRCAINRVYEQVEELLPVVRADTLMCGMDMASTIKMTHESTDNTRNTRTNISSDPAVSASVGKTASDVHSDATQNISLAAVVVFRGAVGEDGRLRRCGMFRQTSAVIAPRTLFYGSAGDMVNAKEMALTMTSDAAVHGQSLPATNRWRKRGPPTTA